jgi:hypothetical protein
MNPRMITAKGYLVVNDRGFVSFKKGAPAVEVGQAALYIECQYPESLVRVPTIKAQFSVTPEQVKPVVINADVITQIEEAVRTASGMNVQIQLLPAEDDKS